MKIKNFIVVLLLILLNTVSVQAYEKDGVYNCSYQIDKYSTGYGVFMTDKNGNVTNSMNANAPSLSTLISSGKCSFSPNKNYYCKYSKGDCNVKFFGGGGHEISCNGITPNTAEVLKAVERGSCIKK